MNPIDPHRPIRVMGILNLTPDSFYAPSRHNLAIMESRADLIDIGACSTRPGSKPVGAREEWRRMKSTLARIRERYPDLPLSIDTYWSDVVRRAYDLIGPFIVNDVSGGDADPRMLATVAELGLTYIPMHHGPAESAGDVLEWYETLAAKTEYQGIRDWIVDPGFGFGKTVEQNFGVFHTMDQLKALHRPLLVGISRKRMVWMPLGLTPETAGEATQRLHLEALRLGADILRTHDVAATRATVALYRQSADAGTL
jgi:dihydropteroate synthase